MLPDLLLVHGIYRLLLLLLWILPSMWVARSFVTVTADPGGHIISMLAFGYLGYWAHRWDERASVLIAEKRAEITERRKQRIARAEEASAAALAEAS